jgi:hypothetical protein
MNTQPVNEEEIWRTESEKIQNELKANALEKKELFKTLADVQKEIRLNETKHKELVNKISYYEDLINKMETFLLISPEKLIMFSEDELTEITKGMDKTDYRPLIGGPRWFNLEKIMDDVIKVKQKYQEWSLKEVKKISQIDTLPPIIIYKYTFEHDGDIYYKNSELVPTTYGALPNISRE